MLQKPGKLNHVVFITQPSGGNKDVNLTHLGMNKQKIIGVL